ncbi:MAG: hypothetical protein NTZ16_15280 [Verrucomicrobia bacterium]|nr:hypothetical protein [Verrucomicrobiota bacterium]
MSFTQAPKPAAAVFGKFCLTGFFLFALLARAGATVLLSDNFSGTAGSLLAGTALDTGGNWSIAQTDGGGNMNGKFIFASGGGVVASNNTAANIFTTFDAGTQTNGFTLSVSFIARGYSGIGFSLGFASAMDKGYFQNLATGDVIRFNYAGGGTGPGTFKWAVYDESVLSDNSSSVRAGGQPVSTNDEIRLSITCYPALGMIGGEATNVTQGFLISKLKLGVNTPGLTNLLYVGFGVNDIVVSNAAAPAVIKSFTVSTAPDFNVSRPLVLATNPPPTMTGFAFEDFNGTGTAAFTNVLAEHAPIDLMHAVRPTVYDTVRATYPQKIILKQLAWGGTAGIALDSIYPGHCLMKAGTRLTNSLPATTNDAVLYLEDSSLVAKSQSGIDSITNTPESYVLLYGLDANGRPDWSRAEHVRLITVDTNASSVTVRRAQLGTGPFAFTNGQAVVARHMMFWSGQWQLNFSLQSPRGGPFNLTAAEWFALQVAQILYIGDADGVECDVGRWQWGYPANNPMDCDNDRVADYGYIDGVCSFGLGGQVYQKHLREILGPNKIIQMDGNDAQFGQRGWQYVNGAQMESFPNGNHFERFSEAFLHFRQWVNNVVPVPAFTYAFSKTTTTLFGHVLDTDGSNVDWHFRVGFAASLLIGMPHPFASITDITFDPANPDYNNPNLQEDKGFYKWDEYVGGTNDLNSWKWLGSPTGPAAQITNNLVPANLLAATVWEWKTETNFTAAVAITNGEYSAAISQIPSNTLPWTSGVYPGTSVPLTLWAGVRLQAAAGAPALQPGREYTLEFDARGNDSWDYAGQTFPKVPRALAIYGIANNGNNNPLAIALGPVWKTYRVTLNSDSTNPPPIIFAVSEQVGNAALRNLHLYQGGAERWVRRYENGIVLLNMTKQPWTNTLTAPYRRINGTQNPDLNDGQPVPANIVVPVWDALFLVANATNLTWQGASAGSADWGNALTGWTNSTGVATFTSSNAVTFDNTAPALTVNLPGTVTPVAINITNDAAHNLTLAGGGKISGETFLAKTGPGAVTLANTGGNDFTGGVLLKAGTLNLGAATALGAATGTLTITGGALDNTSGGALTTPDYPQAWNGDFAFTGTADLNLGAGATSPPAASAAAAPSASSKPAPARSR